MADHTCTATVGQTVRPPCPGCQEHFEQVILAEQRVLSLASDLARGETMPFLEAWEPLYEAAKALNRLRWTSPPSRHLFEFGEAGYYAALSKEDAFRLYGQDIGLEQSAAEADFVREVPDEELVAVYSEDKWDDPRERYVARTRRGEPTEYCSWVLNVTAREWANVLTHGSGYVFGGDND